MKSAETSTSAIKGKTNLFWSETTYCYGFYFPVDKMFGSGHRCKLLSWQSGWLIWSK